MNCPFGFLFHKSGSFFFDLIHSAEGFCLEYEWFNFFVGFEKETP